MPELAGFERGMFAAQAQERLDIGENSLLLRRAARFGEGIPGVIVPSTGEIAAVVGVSAAGHSDFIAVAELRNPAQRECQPEGKLEFFRRTAFRRDETRDIVIAKEWNEEAGARIERIVAEHVRDARGRRTVQQDIAKRKIQREIENGREAGVDAVPAAQAADKKRGDRRIRMKDFADGGQVRINSAKSRVPSGPEAAIHAGECIQTKSVEPRTFRPPNAVLQQILRHNGVFRIEVRQNAEKPAFGEVFAEAHGRMRIGQKLEKIVRLLFGPGVKRTVHGREGIQMIRARTVEPIGERRMIHPRMQRSNMIRDGIEENLDVLLVSRSDEVLIVREGAEMGVHIIEIHGAVAVIILGSAVLHDGREPERGYAEILEITEVFANAAEVAAVIRARLGTVIRAGCCERFVIRRIAVRKAVRHDQVENVAGREALKSAGGWLAGGQRKFKRSGAAGSCDAADRGTRAGFGSDAEPDEKIGPAGARLRAHDLHRRQITL